MNNSRNVPSPGVWSGGSSLVGYCLHNDKVGVRLWKYGPSVKARLRGRAITSRSYTPLAASLDATEKAMAG